MIDFIKQYNIYKNKIKSVVDYKDFFLLSNIFDSHFLSIEIENFLVRSENYKKNKRGYQNGDISKDNINYEVKFSRCCPKGFIRISSIHNIGKNVDYVKLFTEIDKNKYKIIIEIDIPAKDVINLSDKNCISLNKEKTIELMQKYKTKKTKIYLE